MGKIILSETQFLNLKKKLNKKVIKEEVNWYNYVMDVVGMLDPTPTTDLINAMSYWKQGEEFYAVMSLLSAVPYAGDFVGKPVMVAARGGSKSAKKLKDAFDLMETNPHQANKILKQLANGDDVIAKMIKSSKDWGPSLEDKLVLLPEEMSGLSNYLSKILAFLQRNSVSAKWAYGLFPDDEDDEAPADPEENFPEYSDNSFDNSPQADPLRNMFGGLFSGKLI